MTAMQSMPQVQECSVSSCSYNADSSCHAGAITIAGDHAHCGTFVEISFRGGMDRAGLVGACHRSECTYNEKLECTAASVLRVGAGADVADCLTYSSQVATQATRARSPRRGGAAPSASGRSEPFGACAQRAVRHRERGDRVRVVHEHGRPGGGEPAQLREHRLPVPGGQPVRQPRHERDRRPLLGRLAQRSQACVHAARGARADRDHAAGRATGAAGARRVEGVQDGVPRRGRRRGARSPGRQGSRRPCDGSAVADIGTPHAR